MEGISVVLWLVGLISPTIYLFLISLFLGLMLYLSTYIIQFRKRSDLHESVSLFPRCWTSAIQIVVLGAVLAMIFVFLFVSALYAHFGGQASNPLTALASSGTVTAIAETLFSDEALITLVFLGAILLIFLVLAYSIKSKLRLEFKWALLLIVVAVVLTIGINSLVELGLGNSPFYYFQELGDFVRDALTDLILLGQA